MPLVIELDGKNRQQCPAPVGHGGIFIVLDKFSGGWMPLVKSLDRSIAIEQDQG